jgi:hypothetical protein
LTTVSEKHAQPIINTFFVLLGKERFIHNSFTTSRHLSKQQRLDRKKNLAKRNTNTNKQTTNQEMSFELVAQVGALVGASVLLFVATQPRSGVDAHRLPKELQGIQRYSSYHRKRYFNTKTNNNNKMYTIGSSSGTTLPEVSARTVTSTNL